MNAFQKNIFFDSIFNSIFFMSVGNDPPSLIDRSNIVYIRKNEHINNIKSNSKYQNVISKHVLEITHYENNYFKKSLS